MEDGDSIEFEKIFIEGKAIESKFQPMKEVDGKKVVDTSKPISYSYSCKVKYSGEEVTFFLKEHDHKNFKACGEAGSKVRLDVKEEKYVFKGQKKIRTILTFTEL